MKIYKIKDWANLYENNRTRELKNMAWVPVPNTHDGDGYTELVDRKNGAAMLGAWLVILQVASKCDPRGTLLRDSKKPHNAASLSRMTRLPEAIIQEALDVCSHHVQWLEIIEDNQIPQDDAGKPQEGAAIPHPTDEEQKGTEGKGMNGKEPKEPTGDFEAFWFAYPRKASKKLARLAFDKNGVPSLSVLLKAIESQKQSDQWKKDGGQFIPHPATWLNQGRWNDEMKIEMKSETVGGRL